MLEDGLDRARMVEETGSRKGSMEKPSVVFKGYGKAFRARRDGVLVSAEDLVRALVKVDGPMKRDSWSGMVLLRRSVCEQVAV